jgi:hypothetical protein
MDLVEDLADPIVPIKMACLALGVSRASLYRGTRPAPPRCLSPRAPSPRRISDIERAAILAAVHSAEFADQSVMEIYATLLSRGIYLASIRTITGLSLRAARRRSGGISGALTCTRSPR